MPLSVSRIVVLVVLIPIRPHRLHARQSRRVVLPLGATASFLYSASPATPRSPQASMIAMSPLSGGGSPSAAAKLQQATSAWRSERKSTRASV